MHTDPELLGLLALGEHAGTDAERGHTQTCPECASELSELNRLATLGRSVTTEAALATPSPTVWAAICAELAFDENVEPAAQEFMFPLSDVPRPPTNGRSVEDGDLGQATTRGGLRSVPATIKSAIAGLTHGVDDKVTAHAQLTPAGSSWSKASGRAELATDQHGRRLLQVTVHADLPESGVRGAWLVHRDDPTRRQALGVLDGVHGLWTVSHSIDLAEYPILEICQQATAEKEHSGQTIVRGELALAS